MNTTTKLITVQVHLSVTGPDESPDEYFEIRGKRCVASALENRGDAFEKCLPEGWEVFVTSPGVTVKPPSLISSTPATDQSTEGKGGVA